MPSLTEITRPPLLQPTLGKVGDSPLGGCKSFEWLYPDENIEVDRRGSFELGLPTRGPTMVVCTLHAALAYANTIPDGSKTSPEVVVLIAQGSYAAAKLGPLPTVRRSLALVGADALGCVSSLGRPPLCSLECGSIHLSGRGRGWLQGGWDAEPPDVKSSFVPSAAPANGVMYELKSVLRGDRFDRQSTRRSSHEL